MHKNIHTTRDQDWNQDLICMQFENYCDDIHDTWQDDDLFLYI